MEPSMLINNLYF